MAFRTISRCIARRFAHERGYTLIELLVVLGIMGIVLGALVASFATGLNQQAQQGRRESAYSSGRLALQRMRLDIHCAAGAGVYKNDFGGFTLTLQEVANPASTLPGPPGWCAGVIPAGVTTSGVQWCSIPYPGDPNRWQLFRYLGTGVTECNGGPGSTFQVDYLAATPGVWPTNSTVPWLISPTQADWAGNLWPTPPPCVPNRLHAIAVDMNFNVDPVKHANEHYQLRDAIALRNSERHPPVCP